MALNKIISVAIVFLFLPIVSAEKLNNDRIFKQSVQEHKDEIKKGKDLLDMMAKRIKERDLDLGVNASLCFRQAFEKCDNDEQRKTLFEAYGASFLINLNIGSFVQKLTNAIALDCLCRLTRLQFPQCKLNATECALIITPEEESEIKKRIESAKNQIASAKTTKIACNVHSFMVFPFLCGAVYGAYNKDSILTGLCAAGLGMGLSFPWAAKKYILNHIIIDDPITDESVNRQIALNYDVVFYSVSRYLS